MKRELVKFKVEDKEYQLQKLLTDGEVEALKKTYEQVNVKTRTLDKEQRRLFAHAHYKEHHATIGPTLKKCFGWTEDELNNTPYVVAAALYLVLCKYLFTGKVIEYPNDNIMD